MFTYQTPAKNATYAYTDHKLLKPILTVLAGKVEQSVTSVRPSVRLSVCPFVSILSVESIKTLNFAS